MKFVVSVMQRAAGAANAVRNVGEFARLEDAIAAAKRVVDAALSRAYAQGMTAEHLFTQYRESAEAPYIFRDDEQTMNAGSFNHFQYAKTRSDEMCAGPH